MKIISEDTELKEQKVFRVQTYQPSNRYLKEIMKEAKISKEITMHCARHTFATCAMDLGISLEVISEIMGHTDPKTTRIYVKIREGRKTRKWKNGIKKK